MATVGSGEGAIAAVGAAGRAPAPVRRLAVQRGGSDSENMASPVSADFFENGTNKQFEWVLARYQEALQAKADVKAGKAEALLKLDKW